MGKKNKICIKDYATGQRFSFKPSEFHSIVYYENANNGKIIIAVAYDKRKDIYPRDFCLLGIIDAEQLENNLQSLRDAAANGQGYKLLLNYHTKLEKEIQPTAPTEPEPVTTRNDVVELTPTELDLKEVPMICVKDCATKTSFTFPSVDYCKTIIKRRPGEHLCFLEFQIKYGTIGIGSCEFVLSKVKDFSQYLRGIMDDAQNAYKTNTSATILLNKK